MVQNLDELGLAPDEQPEDLEDFAEQPSTGNYVLHQPGDYNFVLPQVFDFEKLIEGGEEYLKVNLRGESALKYAHDNNLFGTQLDNRPIPRFAREGKKGDDLTFLLRDALKETGSLNTAQKGKALVKHAGESFLARLEWSGSCSTKRDAVDKNGKPLGKKGCGIRYREYEVNTPAFKCAKIPSKSNGDFAERFTCSCGNLVRVFGNLKSFRPPTR